MDLDLIYVVEMLHRRKVKEEYDTVDYYDYDTYDMTDREKANHRAKYYDTYEDKYIY
nr:hypothetical protein [uncultured Romboutsia sp.]